MQNDFSANVLLECYGLQALYANDVGPAVSLDHALFTKRGLLMRVSKKMYVRRLNNKWWGSKGSELEYTYIIVIHSKNLRISDFLLIRHIIDVWTCAKVMYNTPIKALYFPRPIIFPLVYAFIHRRGIGNHTGGCLEYDIVSLYNNHLECGIVRACLECGIARACLECGCFS